MLALRFSDYSMVIRARDDPAPTLPPPDMRMPLSDAYNPAAPGYRSSASASSHQRVFLSPPSHPAVEISLKT